jgi:acetyl-CoA carboxylase carboxyltransferase component
MYAWPSAQIAVMGGTQAAKVLTQIRVSALKKKGEEITDEEEQQIMKEISERYDHQTDVRYAAARLWVDSIINPIETRERISHAIQCANHNPKIEEFKTGVMQV